MKTVWMIFKKLQIELLYDPAIPLLGICLDKTVFQKDTCTPVFKAALSTTAKTWKPPKCPLTDASERSLATLRETPKDGDTWEVSTIPSPGAHFSSVPHQRLDWGSLQDDPCSQLNATVQDNPAKSHIIQTRRNKGEEVITDVGSPSVWEWFLTGTVTELRITKTGTHILWVVD